MSALCLAAGRGTRLAPITDSLAKPLCPAGHDRLLDVAVRRAGRHAPRVMVNAHHLADQIADHVGMRHEGVEVSLEERLMGTAGAVGRIRDWLGDDDLLIVNADTVLVSDTVDFVAGWDGGHLRLLVVADPARADFEGVWRYVGVCLVPNALAVSLPDRPAHLFDELIGPETTRGRAELVATPAFYVDCATPADLLVANLALHGGRTVVSDGARLEGTAERSLLMPGSVVPAGESIHWSIRLEDGTTIDLNGELGAEA